MSQTQVERLFIADRTILSTQTFRMTATNQTAGGYITSNWESPDNTSAGNFGSTAVTVSSGVFSFASTGLYKITMFTSGYINNESRYIGCQLIFTNDGSTYDDTAAASYGSASGDTSANYWAHATNHYVADITNTTNQKCKMYLHALNSTYFQGNSNANYTGLIFERLGDT
tara:strand:+ start:362 stop:874 length:513 start_codon:yes stop_codon:yes gene_type:complete